MLRIRYVLTGIEDQNNGQATFDSVCAEAPSVGDFVLVSHESIPMPSFPSECNVMQFRVSDRRWIVGDFSVNYGIDVLVTLDCKIGAKFTMPGPAPQVGA